jgi:pimeloyl-ACP methyl ester carboxylesterase
MALVVFFGGNGHATARLEGARAAVEKLAAAGEIARFDILEVPYPGFEGRPRADDASTFLRALAGVTASVCERPDAVVHATGIGALFAVTLRARQELGRAPMVLQGPVLWGLEHRWMPRAARRGLAPVIPRLFQMAAFQRHFLRKHFAVPPPGPVAAAFFEGYARCAATTDLFRWCGPDWLRAVEAAVHERRVDLGRVQVWWGGRDRVVGPAELRWTEAALGVRWNEHVFAGWGHYPMIEDPEGWARAVAATVPAEAPGMIGG